MNATVDTHNNSYPSGITRPCYSYSYDSPEACIPNRCYEAIKLKKVLITDESVQKSEKVSAPEFDDDCGKTCLRQITITEATSLFKKSSPAYNGVEKIGSSDTNIELKSQKRHKPHSPEIELGVTAKEKHLAAQHPDYDKQQHLQSTRRPPSAHSRSSREKGKRKDDINEEDMPALLLQRKPKEPPAESCCGEGCSPCVYDIYEQELKLWKKDCVQYFQGSQASEEGEAEECMVTDFYKKYALTEVVRLTEKCNIYRFLIPKNSNLTLKNGRHLILRAVVNGKHVTRQYTPISPPGAKGYFDVMIKVYDTGMMSNYVCTWHPGIDVEWRGPFGGFDYVPNTFYKVMMIAAGTGIAPMIQLIYSIIENEDDETFIRLLFCCKTYTEILLKNQLDLWKSNWNFTVKYFLSKETDCSKKNYGDEIHYGHIDSDAVSAELSCGKSIQVLICGSKAFNQTLKQFLCEIGLPEKQYFVF